MQQLLFEDKEKKQYIVEIPIDNLIISSLNPRYTRTDEEIEELARHIETHGFSKRRGICAIAQDGHYEVFAGGSRLLASKKAGLSEIPVVIFEGYNDDEIVAEADRDNKEDEFHKPLSILDTWRYYYELSQRPPDKIGKWTQERIAKAVGENRTTVTERINWHKNLPEDIRKNVEQSKITEGHLRKIASLSNVQHFSSWLTTEQLWIDIANWVVEKKKSVSETEKKVNIWKSVIDEAKGNYNKLSDVEKIGNKEYHPCELFIEILAREKAYTKKAINDAYSQVLNLLELAREEYQKWLTTEQNREKQKQLEEERERKELEKKLRYESQIYIKDFGNLEEIDDGSIDLIITDPPYGCSGNGQAFKQKDEDGNIIFASTVAEWDKSNKEREETLSLLKQLIDGIKRVLKPNGQFYIFVGKDLSSYLIDMIREAGLYFKDTLVWHKTNPTPQVHRAYLSSTEFILWGVKGSDYTFNIDIKLEEVEDEEDIKGKIPHNLFETSICMGEERTEHPTQKPVELIKQFILYSSNIDDMILDPFLGSGTTCDVAKGLKRRSIGYEKESKYKEIIDTRLDKRGVGELLIENENI